MVPGLILCGIRIRCDLKTAQGFRWTGDLVTRDLGMAHVDNFWSDVMFMWYRRD